VVPTESMSVSSPLTATLTPLKRFRDDFDTKAITREGHLALRRILKSEHWKAIRSRLRTVAGHALAISSPTFSSNSLALPVDSAVSRETIEQIVCSLAPWRIGPFDVGGYRIDSEWRSSLKWDRIHPLIQPGPNLRIADVGCSNGYFLFRLLESSPELAVGFDPVERCWLQFAFLNSLVRSPALAFLPMGITALRAFPSFFDRILCMGVIYHQRDPFTAVRTLYESTRPGGIVLLESLVIDRDGSYFLVPRERYAKMRNAWILPTADALATLMERAGFKDLEIHRFGAITTDEQRRTVHAPYESLADFLDPLDPTRTIEGHPAPHSAAVVGVRK
jgi:tRNA (mo5U34)-methyltransferase